jgi:hypothetical protein
VNVNSLPAISISSTNSIICTGQSATLTATGANTYTWTGSIIANNIAVTPTANTTYSLWGTDLNNCENTAVFTLSVSTCTGMDQIFNDGDIRIYPNPGNGVFKLTLPNFKNVMVEVYSSIGQKVISKSFESQTMEIDLSAFAEGVYILKLQNSERNFKIVKQ